MDAIDRVYNRIHAMISLKLNALKTWYGLHQDDCNIGEWTKMADRSELDDILATLLELRTSVKKLQWFGKVNCDGFSKILKKAKRVRSLLCVQGSKIESKLCISEFASQQKCLESLEYIDALISEVNQVGFQAQHLVKHGSLLVNAHFKRDSPFPGSSFVVAKSIHEDDSNTLNTIICHHKLINGQPLVCHQPLLLTFLRYGTLRGSRRCIDLLLSYVDRLHGCALIDGQNYLHHLIIGIRRKAPDRLTQTASLSYNHNSISLLKHVLKRLSMQQLESTLDPDVFGRQPLHYAAESGHLEATQLLLQFMANCNPVSASKAALMEDIEGQTALSLAVVNGYIQVISALLQSYKGIVAMSEHSSGNEVKLPGSTLLAAIRSGFVDGVALLLKNNLDLKFQDEDGQTPLFIATRFGFVDCVKLLLHASHNQNMTLDTPELGRGWTPLTMAATSGNLIIVQLLVDAGANQKFRDYRGLTAREQAGYRGFLKVAEVLEDSRPKEPLLRPTCIPLTRKQSYTNNPDFSFSATTSSVLGDDDQCFQIFINLGSLSTKKNAMAVDLSGLISNGSPPESNLYIKIRTVDGSQASDMTSLPLLEDRSNEPWLFWTKELRTLKLVFDVFCKINRSCKRYQILGSGIAILSDLTSSLGSKRESHVRDYTIPLLQTASLKFIGTITFSVLVVAPSPYRGSSSIAEHRQWMDEIPVIIGHRGK